MSLLFRVPSLSRLALAFSDGSSTCLGFFPLRGVTRARPLTTRLPRPRYVPSSGFRSLSTVSSALGLAGLFHPAATSRVLLFKAFPPPRSHPPSSGGACPLAVRSLLAHRPRSAATRNARDFEASIRAKIAFLPVELFTAPVVAALFRFFSSRSPFRAVAPIYSRRSTLDVAVLRLRFRARAFRLSSAYSPRDLRLVRLRPSQPARVFEPSVCVSEDTRTVRLSALLISLLRLPAARRKLFISKSRVRCNRKNRNSFEIVSFFMSLIHRNCVYFGAKPVNDL